MWPQVSRKMWLWQEVEKSTHGVKELFNVSVLDTSKSLAQHLIKRPRTKFRTYSTINLLLASPVAKLNQALLCKAARFMSGVKAHMNALDQTTSSNARLRTLFLNRNRSRIWHSVKITWWLSTDLSSSMAGEKALLVVLDLAMDAKRWCQFCYPSSKAKKL